MGPPSCTTTRMKRYVCSFAFSPDRARVLLILKNRPAWQEGKLNGVGGKIEEGELAVEAARREFREETSLDVPESSFQHLLTLSGPDDFGAGMPWEAFFFRLFAPIEQAVALTDEKLEIHPVDPLPEGLVPNLRWIIPLFLDDEVASKQYSATIVQKE